MYSHKKTKIFNEIQKEKHMKNQENSGFGLRGGKTAIQNVEYQAVYIN